MNDHSPLEPVGDASLEARIVAWVLGEASAFEAGELERLCAERPELLVFRRRMRALHGLLSEAEAAEPDDAWKLPPDKRAKIEELFGESQPEPEIPVLRPVAPRRWLLKTILTAAACVMFGMLYRFGFAGISPSYKVAMSEAQLDKSSPQMSRPIINQAEALKLPASPKAKSNQWYGRSDENGRIAGEKQSWASIDSGGKPTAGADYSYKAKAAQAVAETESLAVAQKPESQGMRDFGLTTDNEPSEELPNPVAAADPSMPAGIPKGAATSNFDGFANFGSPVDQSAQVDPFASSQGKDNKLAARRPVSEAKPAEPTGDLSFATDSDASLSRFDADTGELAKKQLESGDDDLRQSRQVAKSERAREGPDLGLGAANGSGFGGGSGGGVGGRMENAPIDEVSSLGLEKKSEQFYYDTGSPAAAGDITVSGKFKTADRLTLGDGEGSKGQAAGEGEGATDAPAILTGGLRSGDGVITRNNIDALLNNPNRATEESRSRQLADLPAQPSSGPVASPPPPPAAVAAPAKPASAKAKESQDSQGFAQSEFRRTAPDLSVTGQNEHGSKSTTAEVERNEQALQSLAKADKKSELKDSREQNTPAVMFESPLRTLQESASAIDTAVDSQDYEDAKRELDSAKKMLDLAKQTNVDEVAIRENHLSPEALNELRKAVRDQEDKVEERRKLMTTIVRTKGIIPTGEGSLFRNDSIKGDRGAGTAGEMESRIEQDNVRLQSQIKNLEGLMDLHKLSYASSLDLPENGIKTLFPQYLEQKRDLDAMKTNGLADGHPSVRAKIQEIENTKKQLDEGVSSLKGTLEAQLDLSNERLAKVRILAKEKGSEAIDSSINSADYLESKKALEESQAKLEALQKKLIEETIAQQIHSNNGNLPKILREQQEKLEDRQKLLNSIEKVRGITPTKLPKTAPAPIPTDETSASGEAFSTFSLHVSDASFKVAKAALDRGERPDPESVRPEEFYNAFDYGDPTPAPGEPVACAIEQAAHPLLPQRNLVRIAMRTGAAGRAASQPLNLTVLLDHSGSMEREDRHEGLNQAIVQLASLLKAGDTITVAGFSRTPRLMADRLPGERAKELIDIVRNTPSEGGTNLEEALKLGGDLALRQKNPAAQNRIVLLTDGAANLGNAKPEDLAERIRALRQQGISFDAAGLGAGGVNDRMLETLTRDGNGRYYLIDQPSDADANFARQLAGAFRPAAENVKVQVHFNPARVGRYKLIGFEKHRLKTEDFRNDKVDAAELAAEEAGVALYQVETLPQGTGEIGEASVRFKDTSTGQMVEQTWTIPYDEKTPAFDQAAPSMQLASLAALTAEKLRGGPLAGAIDFQSLTPQTAKVRSYYSTSRKVGDLVEMIGKLK